MKIVFILFFMLAFFWRFICFLFEHWEIKAEAKRRRLEWEKQHRDY